MTMINQAETQTENVDEREIITVENNYWLGMKQDLDILRATPAFKNVVENGYFRDRAVNAVSMLCAPSTDANRRKELLDEMYAISNLQWYFKMLDHMGTSDDSEE